MGNSPAERAPQQSAKAILSWRSTLWPWVPQPKADGLLTDTVGHGHFRKILEIVNTGSVYSINSLAMELNLSPSHLQHLFKAETGSRLGHWLVEQRLHRAALLLLQSDMSVKEVAYAVGYKHTPSFVRALSASSSRRPDAIGRKC